MCVHTLLHRTTSVYTFEGNHCLINAVLYMWVVVVLKFGLHGIDKRENLLQSVVPRLIPQRQVSVVNKVQVPGDFLESVSGYPGCVVEHRICRPVVADLGEMVEAHDNHEA